MQTLGDSYNKGGDIMAKIHPLVMGTGMPRERPITDPQSSH